MAKQGGMPIYKNVNDYLNAQNHDVQNILQEFIRIIEDTIPTVQEIKNSKVPSFRLVPDKNPKKQIMIAVNRKSLSFYSFEAVINHFSNDLQEYELGRGTIKFPHNKPLPEKLIKKMLLYRKKELQKKV